MDTIQELEEMLEQGIMSYLPSLSEHLPEGTGKSRKKHSFN
jgi:hypothetical protein